MRWFSLFPILRRRRRPEPAIVVHVQQTSSLLVEQSLVEELQRAINRRGWRG